MVWPSNSQRRLGIVAKKGALNWHFPASVILSTMGMMAGMNWRLRGDTDLPGHTVHPSAAHCPWEVGFHLQSEAAEKRDQPLLPLVKHRSPELCCSWVSQALFQQDINLQLMQAATHCHTGIMHVFMALAEREP